jgi:hypothetical protein
MLDGDTYTATLDRFEDAPDGELAVLVVEHDGEAVGQLDLPVETIPTDGRSVDSVFSVVRTDGRFELTYRADETTERAESAQARFDRLARRPPGDGDGNRNGGG